ncbi:MAG TPA: hypothetical protein VMJ10_36365 [Kofleriaceae bacterium]|nr:hypothetical protein [Kofleriaceae bacterium]
MASAKVDVTDLCVPYNGVQIKSVAPGTTTLDHQFTYDKLGALQSLAASIEDLTFVSIDGHAASGVPDLSFIQAAHVTVGTGNPNSSLPTVDAYDCDGDCVPDGSSLSVPAALQQSAIAYIESGSVLVDLELDGDLPTQDWTVDIDLCFRGEAGYSL